MMYSSLEHKAVVKYSDKLATAMELVSLEVANKLMAQEVIDNETQGEINLNTTTPKEKSSKLLNKIVSKVREDKYSFYKVVQSLLEIELTQNTARELEQNLAGSYYQKHLSRPKGGKGASNGGSVNTAM